MEHKARRGGFTLIELLVVMVIISLVAGFGVPQFMGSIERAEVKGAAGQVAAVMRAARGRAIASRQPATAVVDTESRRAYVVAGKFDPEKNRHPVEPPVEIPSSVKIWSLGEKTVSVEFNPSGSSTTCELSFTAEHSRAGNDEDGYHIAIDPLTGRAKAASNADFKSHETQK